MDKRVIYVDISDEVVDVYAAFKELAEESGEGHAVSDYIAISHQLMLKKKFEELDERLKGVDHELECIEGNTDRA